MTDRNRKIIVFSLLAVAVVWGAWNLLPGGGSGAGGAQAGYSDPDPDDVVKAAAVGTPRAHSKDTLAWSEDPFARRGARTASGKQQPQQVSLHLAAVSARADNAMALINGTVVRVGDKVSGWQVATIEPEAVLLKQGTRSRRLTMKGQ